MSVVCFDSRYLHFYSTKKTYVKEEKAAVIDTELLDLYYLLREFAEKTDVFLSGNLNEANKDMDYIIEQYFNVLDYLNISEYFCDKYVTFAERINSDFSIKLLCLDASGILAEIQKKAVASIFFSATLTPLYYFKNVLGGGDEAFLVRMASPFESEKLCLIVENRISTRYKDRESSYEKIAVCINKTAGGKKGNYFIFFPSYEYLIKVHNIYAELYPEDETLVQSQDMAEEDREKFLLNFRADREKTLLAFAVMGGIFSEGIDLKGEKLIGAVIVGVGLPLITVERNIISDYYNKANDNRIGFEYAYTYPGMNKVMQSAGRVIRTESDKGVIILIDDRFVSQKYSELFPPEWRQYVKSSNIKDIGEHIKSFWDTGE